MLTFSLKKQQSTGHFLVTLLNTILSKIYWHFPPLTMLIQQLQTYFASLLTLIFFYGNKSCIVVEDNKSIISSFLNPVKMLVKDDDFTESKL